MKPNFSAPLLCKLSGLQGLCNSDRSSFLSFINRAVAHTARANQLKLTVKNISVCEHMDACMRLTHRVCTRVGQRTRTCRHLICSLLTETAARSIWKQYHCVFVLYLVVTAVISVHFLFPEPRLDVCLNTITSTLR